MSSEFPPEFPGQGAEQANGEELFLFRDQAEDVAEGLTPYSVTAVQNNMISGFMWPPR